MIIVDDDSVTSSPSDTLLFLNKRQKFPLLDACFESSKFKKFKTSFWASAFDFKREVLNGNRRVLLLSSSWDRVNGDVALEKFAFSSKLLMAAARFVVDVDSVSFASIIMISSESSSSTLPPTIAFLKLLLFSRLLLSVVVVVVVVVFLKLDLLRLLLLLMFDVVNILLLKHALFVDGAGDGDERTNVAVAVIVLAFC